MVAKFSRCPENWLGFLAFTFCYPAAVWMSNDGWLPSAFSDKKSLVETKLAYYEKYGCDLRQQIGMRNTGDLFRFLVSLSLKRSGMLKFFRMFIV